MRKVGGDWSARAAGVYRLQTLLGAFGGVASMVRIALPECEERDKVLSALGEAQLWAGKAFERGDGTGLGGR